MRKSIFLSTLALVACSAADPNARESAGEKAEWSVLQAAEYKARGALQASPEVQTVEGYELLVVPGVDGKNIWVMLNPTAPPYYKQLPEGQFSLSKAYVAQLSQTKRVGYTTAVVLNLLAREQ